MGDHTSPNSVSDFLDYVSKVYVIATQYNTNVKNSTDVSYANKITIEYLRHFKYGDYKWDILLGSYDTAFRDYADGNGAPTHMEDFQDPWPERIKTDHVFAAMNGAFLFAKTALTSGGTPNEGDVAGWGGDWIDFYADWWNHMDVYTVDQGELFCQNYLGKQVDGYYFNLRPCIEDADGFNIAKMLLDNPALPLDQACQQYFHPNTSTGGGYQSRFQDFYKERFGGTTEDCVEICFEMLTDPFNLTVVVFRTKLMSKVMTYKTQLTPFKTMPEVGQFRLFCKGFDDAIQSLIAQEKAKP
jgi:hypothetical protein